jgi:hypothetical protein
VEDECDRVAACYAHSVYIPDELPLLRASAAAAAPVSHPMPTADLASAKSLGFAAVALALLAVLFLPLGFPLALVAVGPGTLALIFGIAALALLPGARRTRAAVEAMRAGDHLLLWSYDADRWQPFVASERRREGRAVWVVAALCAAAGVVTGLLLLDDGDRLLGSAVLTVALPALSLGAFGALLAAIMIRASRHVWTLANEYPGLACLGPGGIYLTGQYRPFRRFGQRFMEAGLSEAPPPVLLFRFLISAGKSSNVQTLRVPVPDGAEALAAEVVAFLNRP